MKGERAGKSMSRHQSTDFTGKRFGRLFPKLDGAAFNTTALKALSDTMMEVADTDETDSTIPSAYAYFGQFIDHDITRDAAGGQIASPSPATSLPEQLATPTLDLDCLYGPDAEYLNNYGFFEFGTLFEPLDQLDLGVDEQFALQDLPRDLMGRAKIADPRNEDNLIVSSIHLLFMQFHNKLNTLARDSSETYHTRADVLEVRDQVIRHYQQILLDDFLPQIVKPSVLHSISLGTYSSIPYDGGEQVFMPLEFSGAAYRFGHSMIRNRYVWNKFRANTGARELLRRTGLGRLDNENKLRANWRIDWRLFWENPSRPIDTMIANALGALPHSGQGNLALRNLLRGSKYGLPCGQDVASYLGFGSVSEQKFLNSKVKGRKEAVEKYSFHKRTPLWFYILQEAEAESGTTLGDVGSTITGETLHWLIRQSRVSVLRDSNWTIKDSPIKNRRHPERLTLPDLINYVSGTKLIA